MNEDYVYWFYYHGYISVTEQENIINHIENHDFEAFLQFYSWYQINKLNNPEGWTYFPDTIFIHRGDGEIEEVSVFDRDNFNKITDAACECG